jgi:hypothetical protein
MKRISYTWLLATAMVFALAPTAAFANGPSPPFIDTGTHGGSKNTCEPGSPGCNTDVNTNPAGNNKTCTSPNPNVCSQ